MSHEIDEEPHKSVPCSRAEILQAILAAETVGRLALRWVVCFQAVLFGRYCLITHRYGIKSIGTKLQVRVENPLMVYTFTMKRLEGQESLRTAMRHPTAEERDDWRIYQRYKHRHLVLPSEVDLSKPGQFILPGSAQSSSFNSRRASAFTTIGPLPDDAGDYFAVQKRKQDTQDNLDEDVISPGDVSRPRSMD